MLKLINNKILLLVAVMSIQSIGFADQLLWVGKNDAVTAVNFLNKNTEAILYCGCCDGDVKQKIHIYSARFSQVPEDKSSYKVSISYELNGDSIAGWLDVDLAYIHSQSNGLWTSVGKLLGMECDTCVTPFTFSTSSVPKTISIIENGFNVGEYREKSQNAEHYLKIISFTELGFKFELQVGTAKMCIGELSGDATYKSNRKSAVYNTTNGCSINFSILPTGGIEVNEDDCAYYHGVECSFDGQFFK